MISTLCDELADDAGKTIDGNGKPIGFKGALLNITLTKSGIFRGLDTSDQDSIHHHQ